MRFTLNKYIKFLILFYVLWVGIIPLCLNKVLPVICENISCNTKYDIQINKPDIKLSILPIFDFNAENLFIKEKNSNNTLSINKPNIRIRLLPLLAGKVHINKISVKEIEAGIHTDSTKKVNKNLLIYIKDSKSVIDNINISGFNITILDKNIKTPIIYKGQNFGFIKKHCYFKLVLNSKLNINNDTSDINLNLYIPQNFNHKKSNTSIYVTNLDINNIYKCLSNYIPQEIKSVSGIVDLNIDNNNLNSTLRNLKIQNTDDAKTIKLPKILNITSKFDIFSGKSIKIESAKIFSENIHINCHGNILNYTNPKFANMNLEISVNKTKIKDIIDLLPAVKTEDINTYYLKKYGFLADAIGNLTIKGNFIEPQIFGNVFIDNGILIKPIYGARGASIKIKLTGKHIHFDVVVPANSGEKVYVKGYEELYNIKFSDMHIWSTKNVDLQLAESKVLPLHQIFNFVIGPVPIMDIRGKGNIDITVKGNRKNPHVWGNFNINNASAYFIDMPEIVLSKANAVLNFDDEKVLFNLKDGYINNQPANINGTADLTGNFDFTTVTNNQEMKKLYKSIKNSNLIGDIKSIIPDVDIHNGLANLKLKIYGSLADISDIAFNKNLFIKGDVNLLNNSLTYQNIILHNINGNINFKGEDANANITSHMGNGSISANCDIKNGIADISINLRKINALDVYYDSKSLDKDFFNLYIDADAKYKGSTNNINYNNLELYIKSISGNKNNKLQLKSGEIYLKNGKLLIKNLAGSFLDTMSTFCINANITDLFNKPVYNGKFNLNNFEISILNTLIKADFMPKDLKELSQKIKFENGRVNLSATVNSNNINASTNLGGISLTYLPLDLPLKIVNGSLYARKDFAGLNKINIIADGMPVLLDGNIDNIFTKRNFNLYINSKPKQDFIDKYINNNRIYPIKLKGDIVYNLKLSGIKGNFNISATANMEKDSSLYYYGATVGDVENAIILDLDMQVLQGYLLKIKEFSYDKLIDSQGSRKTRRNMLKAYGGIDLYKDDLVFHDLWIKTSNPTDARIFNIMFRKPNIKQGQFTSDLKFNGKLSNPKLLGNFHIFETNIPFLDTSMKNITFKFKDKTIELYSSGEILGNDVIIKSTLKNKLTAPYYVENADIYTNLLDMNYITDKIKSSQVDSYKAIDSFENFNPSSLIVKNMKMKADKILLRNIFAEDISAIAELNENKQFNIKNFHFKAVRGLLDGKFSYNFENNNTQLSLQAKNIDANDLSYAVFDLRNQIHGNLTGNIQLSCVGTNFNHCMETLNGNTTFNVSDGKMPKLGSLEYLLRAGNLIKGGITGLTINSIVDIISPLKTGNFSNIYGNINIVNGIANDIEIASKGKNLSLFLTGTYNFSTSYAEMEVLGILSKKVATMFGGVGNISLNTLFNVIPGVDLTKDSKILEKINKIPAIEFSEKAYRKFIAEIQGNINGENYVKSFKWIN